MAWSPSALGSKTVVRGGIGLYYGANQNDDFSDPLEGAVPRYGFTSSDFPNLSYPLDQFITPQQALFTEGHRSPIARIFITKTGAFFCSSSCRVSSRSKPVTWAAREIISLPAMRST